ncbi:hypothetical protein LTR96_011416 [Exophiala xenobiotica]|nr:hypothetical protein LTR72_011753 [Exophiala xenobiotica]KAK5263154.1 hypothetical protein LTR96_011416 [Exophiala xenobiotica]KAK5282828.1 hypothetical protein LTR14_011970 [Exophiala xenobiotica]KAK5311304.1 hypothetical protein LTR93_011766 [Exophiala xenobiotica]KAK5332443.1 hypothetical protein LTR98_011436 [Exophiala xenobiotica]
MAWIAILQRVETRKKYKIRVVCDEEVGKTTLIHRYFSGSSLDVCKDLGTYERSVILNSVWIDFTMVEGGSLSEVPHATL